MNRIYLFFLLLCGATAVQAQDKLYVKTQKTPIECEVTEVGVNEVKYRLVGRPVPVITIEKQDVVKIVYQSGEIQMITNPLNDFSMYSDQKRWNAKVNIFSPLLGSTQLFLEHATRPGRSDEFELNLIGAGKNIVLQEGYGAPGAPYGYQPEVKFDAVGGGLGYGVKFVRLPDYVNGQVRLRHILQGSYIKPAVSAAYYSRNFISQDALGFSRAKRMPVYSANLSLTFGKQWILDNTISMDMFGTIGYAVDNVRVNEKRAANDAGSPYPFFYSNNTPFNAFGYTRFSSGNFGLGLNVGFRVGYLFNVKKKAKTATAVKRKK